MSSTPQNSTVSNTQEESNGFVDFRVQEPNLGVAVTELFQYLGTAMSSLYRLETSITNTSDASQTRPVFTDMRGILEKELNALLEHLQ
jgi:hypothetical protein